MLDDRTDLAVHSAKDMPTEVPEGLTIVAFMAREDVRDVFVGGWGPMALFAPSAGLVARLPIFVRGRDGRDAFHRRDLAAAREDLFQAVVSPALPVPA